MSRFTIPLGLGNDICHIPRIYKILTSARGPRFVERILTDRERQGPRPARILQCVSGGLPPVKATRDPAFWKAAEFVAGRFAAKEAAIKAYHQHSLTFHDVEIINQRAGGQAAASEGDVHSSGPPTLCFRDPAMARRYSALLTISHDGDYASAVCLSLGAAE